MAVGDPCDVCGSPIPRGSRGPTRRCSDACRSAALRRRGRAYYVTHREAEIAKVRRYQALNVDSIRIKRLAYEAGLDPVVFLARKRNWDRAWRYGLTPDQYDQMVAEQRGVCAICERPETRRGQHGLVLPLSIDHDHETGRVRGLLCARCNATLAFVENAALLNAATDYLRRHSQAETEVA